MYRFLAFLLATLTIYADAIGQSKPNILFIIADDLSKTLGCYGETAIATPAIDKIASQGVVFENAFVSASSCTPSRASILTGTYPHQLKEGGNLWGTLPKEYPNFVTVLGEAGYFTGSTGKGWGPGNQKAGGYQQNPAGKFYRNFDQFLSQKPADQPFFFWLGSLDPHRPYSDSLTARTKIDKSKIKIPGWLPQDSIVRNDIADYLAEVKRFDQQVKRAIETLTKNNLLENTLIIITSDNGMPFPRAKATVYDSGTNIPLIMSWGNKFEQGKREGRLLSMADMAATILDATGVKSTDFGDRSFLPVKCRKNMPVAPHIFVERERHAFARQGNLSYPVRAIRTADYLYIENLYPERWPAGDPERFGDIDGGPTKKMIVSNRDNPAFKKWAGATIEKRPAQELYILKNDKNQLNNMAADAKYKPVIAKLKNLLDEWRAETGDPLLKGPGDVFDSYQYYGNRQFPD